jgi:hypothetical protein
VEFLKNLVVNLHAKGPAAIIVVWCLCVAAIGIFGSGYVATTALSLLAMGGLIISQVLPLVRKLRTAI